MKNKLVLRADLKLSMVGGVTNVRRVPESGGFHSESSVSEGPLPCTWDGEQTCAMRNAGSGMECDGGGGRTDTGGPEGIWECG